MGVIAIPIFYSGGCSGKWICTTINNTTSQCSCIRDPLPKDVAAIIGLTVLALMIVVIVGAAIATWGKGNGE